MDNQKFPFGLLFLSHSFKYLIVSFIFLLLVGGCLEGILRLRGEKPQQLDQIGLANVVADHWSGWRNTPNIRTGPEWVWTNYYGIHTNKNISLKKPNGKIRVAVVGSSVVFGIGQYIHNTIPYALEERLKAKGVDAEVLNFGNTGFNCLNASALIVAYVHQFHPDVIAMNIDLHMAFPVWPGVAPIQTIKDMEMEKLPWYQTILKKFSEYSVILTWADNKQLLRNQLEKYNIPLSPPGVLSPNVSSKTTNRTPAFAQGFMNGSLLIPEKEWTQEKYKEKRYEDLGSVLAFAASFCHEKKIPFYIVTPYGPYFKEPEPVLKKFSLEMLTHSQKIFGSLTDTVRAETILVSEIISKVGQQYGAHVINLLEESKAAHLNDPPHFSTDGLHMVPAGYRYIGTRLADQMMSDLVFSCTVPLQVDSAKATNPDVITQ